MERLIGRHTVLERFHEHLESSLNLSTAINSVRHLEEAVDTLTLNIEAAARLATPSPVQRRTAAKIPIIREILLLIDEKKRLRKRWMRSRHPLDTLNKTQSKPPPIVMEGVDNVCLMMQSIEKIVDIKKVDVLPLYAADVDTFRSIDNWLENEEYEYNCYQLK